MLDRFNYVSRLDTGQTHKVKPFVSNRVKEMHMLTHIGVWNHCPGNDNPAHMVTGGVNSRALTFVATV